ncbi:unnamed protein product, partial [Meganyctiphanes norvegica]
DFWIYDREDENTYRQLYCKCLFDKWAAQRQLGMWHVYDFDLTVATHSLIEASPNRVNLTIESKDRIEDWANFIHKLNQKSVKIIDLHIVDTTMSELTNRFQFDIKGLFKFNLHVYKTSDDQDNIDKLLQVIKAFWPQRSKYSGPLGSLLLQESYLTLDGCRNLSDVLWLAKRHPSLIVCHSMEGSTVTDDHIIQLQEELRLRNCCFDWRREITSG